ncbi:hypothetical protein HOU08_gp008 [Dickeya phage vB_DsoM_JA29]|uniref:Uncharacterized protein n=1 Tax=Dickeya phage vB_DsoM_JA29 TaxID=2283031 RepID=A0A384ZWY0_9CAUD|nr:hypothetical protein HOU08_gp008 [Dickeya phage vB_DsoM_JA29]AXG66734.1 hypothetical protein JA29_008 [Dickeya phage vB_DsoM_JA29]
MTDSNNERHRLICSVPESLPPFDSALIDLDKKGMLKLLLSAAPDVCQIVTLSSPKTPLAKYFPMLFRKKFRCVSFSLEFPNDLLLSGRVVHLFVRNKPFTTLSPLFYRGSSCLHELSQCSGRVIDLYVGGLKFHEALKERYGIKESIVFMEEQ